MKALQTTLQGVMLIEPKVYDDERGFFFESFNKQKFAELTNVVDEFVQDSYSRSARNVLRGLHYQSRHAQGKLVRVVAGEVWDVTVDLRRSSPTFSRWEGHHLSAENKHMLWIPPGFAHGFVVLSESADFLYKTTDYWYPEHERCIRWDDPALAIGWPLDLPPVVSAKDAQGKTFAEAELFE